MPDGEAIEQLEIARAVELPAAPYFLVASAEAVWATLANGSLVKIDDASGAIVNTLQLGPDLQGAWPAIGFGSLWVARLGDGVLTRIDPESMEVESEVQLEASDRPMTIAFGEETLWVANQSLNTVTEIDPARNEVVRTVVLTGPERPADPAPSGLAVVEDSLWISEHRADTIGRLELTTGIVRSTCHGSPDGGRMATDGDALWLVDIGGVISRIDPAGPNVSDRLFLPALGGEISTANGEVWVGSMTHLVRIDPTAVAIDAWAELPEVVDDPDRLILGGLAVAATDAAVWTTDPSGNRLLRIPTREAGSIDGRSPRVAEVRAKTRAHAVGHAPVLGSSGTTAVIASRAV